MSMEGEQTFSKPTVNRFVGVELIRHFLLQLTTDMKLFSRSLVIVTESNISDIQSIALSPA